MRIKLNRTVAGEHGVFEDGQIVDLPDDYAYGLVTAGAASFAETNKAVEKPKYEKATLPKKATKSEKAIGENTAAEGDK